MGKKDGVVPKNIIGMINDSTNDRDIRIGDIDIKDSFSFFEVNVKAAKKVLKSFGNTKYKGKRVNVEIAEADIGGRNSDNGRRKEKKKKKR